MTLVLGQRSGEISLSPPFQCNNRLDFNLFLTFAHVGCEFVFYSGLLILVLCITLLH